MKEWICEEIQAITTDGEVVATLLDKKKELVRCKDCIHKNGLNHCPHNNDIWVADDWFCADGERSVK